MTSLYFILCFNAFTFAFSMVWFWIQIMIAQFIINCGHMKYIIPLVHFFQLFAHINSIIIRCVSGSEIPWAGNTIGPCWTNPSTSSNIVSIEWDWLGIECNLKRKFKHWSTYTHRAPTRFFGCLTCKQFWKILRPTNFRILICIRRILLWIRASMDPTHKNSSGTPIESGVLGLKFIHNVYMICSQRQPSTIDRQRWNTKNAKRISFNWNNAIKWH